MESWRDATLDDVPRWIEYQLEQPGCATVAARALTRLGPLATLSRDAGEGRIVRQAASS